MEKIVLKKEDSLEEQKKKLLAATGKTKGLNAKKYSGVIKVKEDPIKYQKRVRSEWNETSS
ncbi:MAG: hypothetical protein WD357_04765 [Gracilimonas sp.]